MSRRLNQIKGDFMVSLVAVGLFLAVIGALVFVLNTVK